MEGYHGAALHKGLDVQVWGGGGAAERLHASGNEKWYGIIDGQPSKARAGDDVGVVVRRRVSPRLQQSRLKVLQVYLYLQSGVSAVASVGLSLSSSCPARGSSRGRRVGVGVGAQLGAQLGEQRPRADHQLHERRREQQRGTHQRRGEGRGGAHLRGPLGTIMDHG
jgi:hypothetical protein